MSENTLTNIITFILWTIILVIYFLYKYALSAALLKRVKYCITAGRHYKTSLFNEIAFYAERKKLDFKYWFTKETEITLAHEILTDYQKVLSNNFFDDVLIINKDIIRMSCEDYFMFTLCDFLDSRKNKDVYTNNKIYDFSHGKQYTKIYKLTEYGIVFYKLHYIACLYCKENLHLKNKNVLYIPENIQESLDTLEVHMIRL